MPRPIRTNLAAARGAYAQRTLEALEADFRDFRIWCRIRGRRSLPAEPTTLAGYLDALVEKRRRPATIKRHLASLGHLHRVLGHPDPTTVPAVKLSLRRACRAHGVRPRRPRPIRQSELDRLLTDLTASPLDCRDRALLLVARDTLCRRTELTELRAEDLTCAADGSGRLLVRRGKGDQLGVGRVAWLAPETCAALMS